VNRSGYCPYLDKTVTDPTAPLSLAARRVLLLGVRPSDERGLAESFSLLRGLAVCALLGWWREASAAVAETGTHAPSGDVYRAAARLYGRIRVAYAAACAGECRRLEDFERQWRARGRTVHTALANWRSRWVDTGVCHMEGGIASQRLLPSQPPGDLTGSVGLGGQRTHAGAQHAVAPAAVIVHLTARPLRWGIEPHYCWGYTLQRLGGGHAQIVLDRQGREEE
jgi:hypothetical protein